MSKEKSGLRALIRGQSAAFQDMLAVLSDRGRRFFDNLPYGRPRTEDLKSLCELLLSSRGQASKSALSTTILDGFDRLDASGRRLFFEMLCDDFSIDTDDVVEAVNEYRGAPSPDSLARLQKASEPRRQELFRRLNHAPEGTARLVDMRKKLVMLLREHPDLSAVDNDLVHLFNSWFNRGFLELRRLDWNTPAAILDRIIQYEAVHEISDWDDLRRRIDPPDRRLYAFFHPSLPGEPLIFVEVALTKEIAGNIDQILAADREIAAPEELRTAVFYSISNCQVGLRGISFGSFLIKQVLEELAGDLPGLKTFVTLSPIPAFANWLRTKREQMDADSDISKILALLNDHGWTEDQVTRTKLEPVLTSLAARFLTKEGNIAGVPLDPVARFHLGNGARLERVNWLADLSSSGLRGSYGVMVNYLYRPEDIERNHEAFANSGRVVASNSVQRLADAAPELSEKAVA
ncbi:MAG: malonyl-CoA decarboxylase [Mesorhizobium sp.]|nr:malonyl-CoA decarboxylase [Mesorhizobium sp.]MCO5162713.1 malonyl-CoA decarboxylase [Mesorhizobium sp.]